ncbi:molybdate ABC transporter substrate-binding protein [Acidicapsa acidisoli]|uniref:molybdate ABC transporter substrate-binding protein n=1 Tax=Acidicapsa acidisoli TaxID=1615681 RepID=UPI0021DF8AED|nr:molybdate ABC transporter substrate-binding protein [Acidicapsa acidisoli]
MFEFLNRSKSISQIVVKRDPACRPIFMAMALALLAMVSTSISAHAQTAPLRIAAAADLQPVLPPILNQFRESTGIEVQATYQASAALTTQILNGAPFDLFLSADLSYPKRLLDAGKADTAGLSNSASPVSYARGTLVLWTRKDGHWPNPTLETLRDPSLQRIAIANPDRAPYGRAAIAALTNLKLLDTLKPKFVTAENISQTAQFAETGNADAGLISLTSAKTEHLASIGSYFVIPGNLYPPIEQGAVIVSNTPQRQNAHRFLEFLLSPPIQQQLAKSGLTPVN